MSKQDIFIIGALLLFILFFARTMNDINDHRDSNPILNKISRNLALLNPSYGNIPIKEDVSGYTADKEVIALCIVDPDTNHHYDMNTLMYVALHELSHVLSKEKGHEDEWKMIFSKILRKASEIGIYDANSPIANRYCKVKSLI